MPSLRKRSGGTVYPLGGIEGYPLDRLYEEVAFIAYYFHWGYEEIMNMEHKERTRWCEEISAMNKKLSEEIKG